MKKMAAAALSAFTLLALSAPAYAGGLAKTGKNPCQPGTTISLVCL